MASGAAGDGGLFGHVFGGCISTDDMSIQRRPYHRNCNCALHKSDHKQQHCSHASLLPKVSYRIRRSWSEGCLVAMTSSSSSPSSSPCCPSSPAQAPVQTQSVQTRSVSSSNRLPPTHHH